MAAGSLRAHHHTSPVASATWLLGDPLSGDLLSSFQEGGTSACVSVLHFGKAKHEKDTVARCVCYTLCYQDGASAFNMLHVTELLVTIQNFLKVKLYFYTQSAKNLRLGGK